LRIGLGPAASRALAPSGGTKWLADLPSVHTLTDERIAGRAREGHVGEFNELVARYSERIYAFCLRSVGDRHAAEDLAQATFVAAYSSLPRYNQARPFSAWLFGIAVNQCRMHRRRHRRSRLRLWFTRDGDVDEGLEGIPDESPTPEGAVAEADTRQRIRNAVLALPQAYREVLVLRYIEDMPTRDVAEALSLSLEATAKRLTRGTRMLRDRLGATVGLGGGDFV
jgi:RNA polymerase sigma factor (sigma-70 family)